MKTLKKLTLLILSVLIALSIGGCSSGQSNDVQAKFDEFMKQEFVESLENNYLNTHTYLENPKDYGIDMSKTEIKIDEDMNEETFNDMRKSANKTLEKFKEFNRDNLTDEQKETYDIFNYSLKNTIAIEDSKFDYMNIPLESMSGIHTQLPTLFSDWVLRNEQDIKDVLTLMTSVRPYIKSVVEYTKKQEEKGTLMIDIKSVKDYCEKVVKEGSHSSVITGLNKSIDNLQLSDEKTKQYKSDLLKTFQDDFIPAYEDLIKTMNELDSSKNNTMGLAHMKNGSDYYELLLKQTVGTDKSINELKKELESMAQSSLLNAQTIAFENKKVYDDYTNDKIKTKYNDFESMLKYLNEGFQNDFPSVETLNYQIKPIGEDLASGGIAAYFNIPALDASTPKQIRVNMKDNALDIQSMETFSTVAHEGIPGHMYQIAYSYENIKDPWRKSLASFLGYTEGYATYVELYSLKYLNGLPKEAIELQQNLSVYQDCLIALSDIGIHYDGWTKKELSDFLNKNGLAYTEESGLYDQLRANPTAFLSYYIGYVQIANLKMNAQDKLKDKFNDKDFHEVILKSGAAPFSVVEKNVKEYIKNKK